MVLELGANRHFTCKTCGLRRSCAKTWLGRANMMLITFVDAGTGDKASQRGLGPIVGDCMVKGDEWRTLFAKKTLAFLFLLSGVQ